LSTLAIPNRTPVIALVVRALPAALAAFELRYVVTHVTHQIAALRAIVGDHRTAPLALILVALIMGLILREAAAGLGQRSHRASWSLNLLSTWLVCCAGLLIALVLGGLMMPSLGHPLALSGWAPSLPALMLSSLMLAVSWRSRSWLLRRSALLAYRLSHTHRQTRPPRAVQVELGPTAAPLRAGWSDRGPPRIAPAS
jgi:hypothetical protein